MLITNLLLMFRFVLILFVFSSTFAFGQDSIPSYSLSLNGLIANGETVPFWLAYGRHGIYQGNQNEALAIAQAHLPFYLGKHWKIEAGAKVIGKNQFDRSYLQEGFLNIHFGSLQLKAGKEEYTITQYSDELGSGSYYLSTNARPIPRIGIGFYDYVDVPFTKGYLQVKGLLNQGVLDDNRGPRGTRNPLFHEKIAYVRTNKLMFNLHVGLNHSALFGGNTPRNGGTEIPVDYVSVFFGKASDKVGDTFSGEGTNVAGAHLGLADIGVNFDVSDKVHIQTYYQKPFTDGSGYWQFFERNRDQIFGVVGKVKDGFYVKEFIFESMFTLWQSGPGAFDPYVNGRSYVAGKIEDYDQFLLDNYGIVAEGTTKDELMRFLVRTENHGFPYGGRDNYYNNYLYYRGWTYHGNLIGSPVFLTVDRIKSFLPEFDDTWDLYIANTRIKMRHFGLRGQVTENLDYKIKYTYTRNYGTYQGLNKGNYRWDSADPDSDYDYFFKNKKTQAYILIESGYRFKNVDGLSCHLSLGYDYGDLYRSVGAIIGLTYSGNFSIQNRQKE